MLSFLLLSTFQSRKSLEKSLMLRRYATERERGGKEKRSCHQNSPVLLSRLQTSWHLVLVVPLFFFSLSRAVAFATTFIPPRGRILKLRLRMLFVGVYSPPCGFHCFLSPTFFSMLAIPFFFGNSPPAWRHPSLFFPFANRFPLHHGKP